MAIFSYKENLGASKYLRDGYPSMMKYIHSKEFDSGLISCVGGKYLQETQISAVFSEIECPVWQGYNGYQKRDFVAYLWEL